MATKSGPISFGLPFRVMCITVSPSPSVPFSLVRGPKKLNWPEHGVYLCRRRRRQRRCRSEPEEAKRLHFGSLRLARASAALRRAHERTYLLPLASAVARARRSDGRSGRLSRPTHRRGRTHTGGRAAARRAPSRTVPRRGRRRASSNIEFTRTHCRRRV